MRLYGHTCGRIGTSGARECVLVGVCGESVSACVHGPGKYEFRVALMWTQCAGGVKPVQVLALSLYVQGELTSSCTVSTWTSLGAGGSSRLRLDRSEVQPKAGVFYIRDELWEMPEREGRNWTKLEEV